MSIKFTNNATSALAAGVNAAAVSLTLTTGTGGMFPVSTAGDAFYCTLSTLAGALEIVLVTARAGDVLTVLRGQDGTGAVAWNTGDKIELRLVAGVLNNNLTQQTGNNSSAILPIGTTAQRDASALAGFIRFNTDLVQAEIFNGTTWGSVGGGATGGAGNFAFYENAQNVTVNYTLTAGKNAMSAGPVNVNTGVTVTIPSGATWSIV